MVLNNFKTVLRGVVLLALGLISGSAFAAEHDWSLNLPMGVTPMSQAVYHLHMQALWTMVVIGVVVFGIIIFSLIFHRKSAGHKAAQFHGSTAVEIIWTIIPFIILISLAAPSATLLMKMTNASDPAMSIKIEGYQWMWQYDYLQQGFSYFSKISAASNAARQLDSGISPFSVPHYLRSVDHPMVVPTGEKIRLLIASNDVIHTWWVEDFAVKVDAIPGFVNQGWINVEKPGTYRGSCSTLCGRDHAFMNIVVVAKSPADYQKWVAAMEASHGAYINPNTMQPEQTGSPVVYAPAVLNFNTSTPAAGTGATAVPSTTPVPPAATSAGAEKPGR